MAVAWVSIEDPALQGVGEGDDGGGDCLRVYGGMFYCVNNALD